MIPKQNLDVLVPKYIGTISFVFHFSSKYMHRVDSGAGAIVFGSWLDAFSSPEAALLLVSTKNRDLWPSPTPKVRDSRTFHHSAHVQSKDGQI